MKGNIFSKFKSTITVVNPNQKDTALSDENIKFHKNVIKQILEKLAGVAPDKEKIFLYECYGGLLELSSNMGFYFLKLKKYDEAYNYYNAAIMALMLLQQSPDFNKFNELKAHILFNRAKGVYLRLHNK